MLKPTIDNRAIKELIVELKSVDPGLARQMNKDIKNELLPVANAISSQLSKTAPLSGFVHDQRTKWAPHKIGVSVTPGAGWGRAFVAFTDNSAPGTKMVEFAGKGKRSYVGKSTKGRYKNEYGQGKALIRNLDKIAPSPGKQGRFFFPAYLKNKKGVFDKTQVVIDRYVDELNRKFD